MVDQGAVVATVTVAVAEEAKDAASTSKRRSSKLPARNRSYRTSDIVSVVDVQQQEGTRGDDDSNDNNNNNNNSECTEKMISALHTFAGIAGWGPLIPSFFVQDFKIMFLSSFAVALFNVLVVNLILYKFGKTRTW
jgi:hypothetical protein